MTPTLNYALTGVVLFSVGLSGLFFCAHLLRKILSVNMAGSGVFLVFVALARRQPDVPPDPVPQALVLTGIVVAVSATAVALALFRRLTHEPAEEPHG
ncbi:MAG: NADH-quinone oxidoreductase subunit K [Pirellulaceae bacterium]|nr:NADH-quinone oxidoreductase subunit K [Pirellulaceae bacterium]